MSMRPRRSQSAPGDMVGDIRRRGILIIRSIALETRPASGHSPGTRRSRSVARLRATRDPFKEFSRLKQPRGRRGLQTVPLLLKIHADMTQIAARVDMVSESGSGSEEDDRLSGYSGCGLPHAMSVSPTHRGLPDNPDRRHLIFGGSQREASTV